MMFFKRMARSPFIPALAAAIAMFGALFLIVNDRAMRENEDAIGSMYDSISIECTVLPKSVMGGTFSFSPFDRETITNMDEVVSYYALLSDPAFLHDSTETSQTGITVYGTNDVERYASDMGLSVAWKEGFVGGDFNEGKLLCLVNENVGADTLHISGSDADGHFDSAAPILSFTVAGTYQSDGFLGVIVPEGAFFQKYESLLCYNEAARHKWYKYTHFSFRLDPACNRDIQPVLDALAERLERIGSYSLHANTRELEDALRPLENSLKLQRRLNIPVRLAFILLFGLLAAVLASREKQEILIRRLNGEAPVAVFFGEWIRFAVLSVILILPAVLAAFLFDTLQIILWLLLNAAAGIAASGAMLFELSVKSIVALYQSEQ